MRLTARTLLPVQPLLAGGRVGTASVHATGPNAHCTQVHPSNQWVLAASLGGGQLHRYRFDAATGTLEPTEPPTVPMPQGTGPRHLRFNRAGDRVYLLGEPDAQMHVLSFDAANGDTAAANAAHAAGPALRALPGADLHLSLPTAAGCTPASATATPWLALLWRRILAAQPRGHWPVIATPGFALTEQKHLLVKGQTSHAVGLHAVDSATGALDPAGRTRRSQNPNWITTLTLP